MDEKRNLILIKGENKTWQIERCYIWMFKKIGSGIIMICLRFLYDSHCYLNNQCHDHHQCRDNEAVDHGADACLLHAGEGGI